MPYVVTDNCIRCKFTDCVEICPTDCFHEGENMLVIEPEACIDCGICVPECPAGAIIPDTDAEAGPWLSFNAKYSRRWPLIFTRRDPLPEAEAFDGVPNKFPRHFSSKPGKGD